MPSSMRFPVDEVGSIGVVRDEPAYRLPPEAWSRGENVRIVDSAVEKLLGWAQVMGTPGVAPYFLMNVLSASESWWLYASLTKLYAFNGSVHIDVTRAVGGDYTAGSAASWNGTILGGIPIINSGNDVPQFWSPYSIATDAQDLTNWTSTHRCKVMRAFGPYLIALNVTKAGVVSPHMVKWSHPADPGTLPSSWDHTDPEVDAGERELPDVNSGLILDGFPMGGRFMIYKESAIWAMRSISGTLIFAFDTFLETAGVLCTRAVCSLLDGKHILLSNDDIIVHDGKTVTPIATKRFKRTLFNAIDPLHYEQTFIFDNPAYNEAWICYPEIGATRPTRALIWNYRTNGFTEADISFVASGIGTLQSSSVDTWDTAVGTWDSYVGQWSSADAHSVVVADPTNTKFYQLDSGSTRDGTVFTAYVQREQISLERGRVGGMRVDFKPRRQVNRIWPRVSGGPVRIRAGYQNLTTGAVSWSAYQAFDPASQMYLDFTFSGRTLAIEVQTVAGVSWRLEGYDLEMGARGNF